MKFSRSAALFCLITLTVVCNSFAASTLYGSRRHSRQSLVSELIYIGPGDSTYSLFGHVALRLKSQRKDLIYDLGITSHIGLNGLGQIARGTALFHGERRSFTKMLKSWRRRDRDVIAYPIHLDARELQMLELELESRTQGSAQTYLYDPLRENCATQLRQVLDLITLGAVSRSVSKRGERGRSFRDDTRDGYAKRLGVLGAIELIVGPSLDQDRSAWSQTYRPKTFVDQLKRIRIGSRSLLGKPRVLYARRGHPTTGGSGAIFIPMIFLSLLVVVLGTLSLTEAKKRPGGLRKRFKWMLWGQYYLMCLSASLMSCLSIWLTITSSWIEVRNSWLLVIGCPLDLLLLTLTPHSSILRLRRGLFFLKSRGITSAVMVSLIFVFMGQLPTLSLVSLYLLTCGACYLSLHIIESSSSDSSLLVSGEANRRGDDSESTEEHESDGRSWLEM